jgi:serine/threonine-protein kinase
MQLTRLGPYEIGKPLGKGGMGSVYEATNIETGQRVAVKALTPHLAMAEGFRERFDAEIESLKALRHEGIVRLYGYGEQDGVLFYSMELVDGVSLEDELRAGRRFAWREVTQIAIQLSLALKHAHDHGIVHRDIKPANILLYDEDRVKLADFGIARLFGNTQLTTAGGVLGTADYMSPEQADGRPVTARCDQYSLGGVMYALLAGRPPFRAVNLPQMLQLQRFARPEPVRRYAPEAPEQLERVIGQLLAKEPAERFPNMQVLARHLQAMTNALSRPTADDFALVGDESRDDRSGTDWEHSRSMEATQADAEEIHRRSEPPPALTATDAGEPRIAHDPPSAASADEAATLAADDAPPVANPNPETNGSTTRARAPAVAAPLALVRPTRFTTVEEEEARRARPQPRSWLLMVAKLLLLVTVLTGIGGVAVYMAQPPTADDLYLAVTAHADTDNTDSLANVEKEVHDFIALYPNDPRRAEMLRFQEQMSLDKLERKLLRTRRGGAADPALLPAEQLYLRAMNEAADSPAAAAAILQSLVDLHADNAAAQPDGNLPTVPDDSQSAQEGDARIGAIVQLAKRQLATLQADIIKQTDQQLAALQERLAAAERLTSSEPDQAAAIYRAIIDLYAASPWADSIVSEARRRLADIREQQ